MPSLNLPCWLMAMAVCAGPALADTAAPPTTDAAAQLLELQGFVGDDEREPPTAGLKSADCSVRLLSAALHYRREPNRYRNEFLTALVIDDYAERSKGRYNMISAGAAALALESAMATPDGVTDESVRRVVAFCRLKDRNLWVATETQPRISLARMVRGAALVSLLEGTDEDALAIANAIDAQAAGGNRR